MTYPTVTSQNTVTEGNTSYATHTVTLPATINANDLLLMVGSIGSTSTTITAPSGWSTLFNDSKRFVFYKTAVGNEAGTTVTFTTSGNRSSISTTYSISNWSDTPAISTWTNSTNPPALTSGFGVVDTLWIAVLETTNNTPTAGPSGYSGFTSASALYGSQQWGAAYITTTASSEDPGVFTVGAGTPYSNTIAIKGVSANNTLFFGGDF